MKKRELRYFEQNVIDLSRNNLIDIPKHVFRKVDTEILYLNGNQLRTIPSDIKYLKNLKILHLGNNKLNEICLEILELDQLELLSLFNNQISIIPSTIKNLKNLKVLNIGSNFLNELPDSIGELTNLEKLRVSKNKLEKFPNGIANLNGLLELNIEGNPLKNPPPIEITSRGQSALINYIKELYGDDQDYIYEAKILIIGEGGAGKTTLCRKLLNQDYELKPEEKSTEGIEIEAYYFPYKGKDFRVNMWDFGGQEIYHATHQFFLTKRSLYVLVADSRKEDTDFTYWLNVVELLSDNSPLIIVQNEKQDRYKEININAIRGRFKNFLSALRVNFKTNRGFEKLIEELELRVSNLSHIGTALPKTWVTIRGYLEQIDHNYISLDEYFRICKHYGIENREKALRLSEFLHDLGVFLHFQDNKILKRSIILKTDWGTNAVYKLIDDKRIIRNKGEFNSGELGSVWFEDIYCDMHDELIELMTKFELCYRIENSNNYIIPQLLPVNQPDYGWSKNKNIILRYEYQFMPKGIMTRFIVRMHRYIKSRGTVWKEGVLLFRDETNAEVIQAYDKDEIRIRIEGKHKKELLTIILEEFDKIHRTYQKIKVEKLIPCNCSRCKKSATPYFYRYDDLRTRKARGKRTIECNKSYEDVNVNKLIDDILDLAGVKLSIPNLIIKLKSEIAKNNSLDAIKELLTYFQESNQKEALKELLVISSSLTQTESEYNLNLIDREKYSLAKSKINSSILNIIEIYLEENTATNKN